jgi:dTMP kinase
MSGAFITIEGIEGVGKSTSLEAIQRCLVSLGHQVILTREPGGTPFGERVRDWILNSEHSSLSVEVEALLMFAARAHHLQTVILPALERGDWVLCDRFTDATVAYQGGGRGLSRAFLNCLADGVQKGLKPHLTLLLDAPVEVGRSRIRDRKADHFERESETFFDKVRQAYLDLARSEPERIKVIDAARPRERVIEELDDRVRDFAATFGSAHD